MNSTPVITTVILTYRRPLLLKKAIESVLRQTYPHFRLIICDNASGDETASVVKEYHKRDARVKYYCHDQTIPMIQNYKFGISLIETEYFSLLSDDDVILPCFYETALDHFIQYPEAGLFIGSTIFVTQKRTIKTLPTILRWPREGIYFHPDGMLEMIGKYPVLTGTLLRKVVLDHVAIDEENCLTWDCDFFLHIAIRFPIIISKKPCAIFLQHNESFSGLQNSDSWEKSYCHLIKRVINNPELSSQVVKEVKNRILFELYHMHMHFKQFDKSALVAQELEEFASQNPSRSLSRNKSKFALLNLPIFNPLKKFKHYICVLKKLEKQYGEYFKYLD